MALEFKQTSWLKYGKIHFDGIFGIWSHISVVLVFTKLDPLNELWNKIHDCKVPSTSHWVEGSISAVHYSAGSTVQCSTLQCSSMQFSDVQCSAVQCSAAQCSVWRGQWWEKKAFQLARGGLETGWKHWTTCLQLLTLYSSFYTAHSALLNLCWTLPLYTAHPVLNCTLSSAQITFYTVQITFKKSIIYDDNLNTIEDMTLVKVFITL